MRRRAVITSATAAVALGGGGVYVTRGGLDRVITASADGNVVEVSLVDAFAWFDVTPDVVEVEQGSSLTIEVVNRASGPHDLELAGVRTRVLEPGEREQLRIGRIVESITGRCTVGEHDSAGMTVEIRVVD